MGTFIRHRFFVTFGQKSPFRNGYIEITVAGVADIAEAKKEAHAAAMHALGDGWSSIYHHDEFVKSKEETQAHGGVEELFPAGKFGETIKI